MYNEKNELKTVNQCSAKPSGLKFKGDWYCFNIVILCTALLQCFILIYEGCPSKSWTFVIT